MLIYDPYHLKYVARQRRGKIGAWSIVALAVIGLSILAVHTYESKEEEKAIVLPMKKSHNILTDKEWRMKMYFVKNGSKSPEDMALAVLARRSPRLLARIAVVETNGNPHLRAYGYKKKHDGAWGVNREYWGVVSKDPMWQAMQAEFALETKTKEAHNNIVVALNNYGGDVSKQTYANTVLSKLAEVPKN